MQKQFNPTQASHWWLKLVTFSVAALAAGSATVWGLKLSAPAPQLQATAVATPGLAHSDAQAWVRLLGGQKVDPAAAPEGVAAEVSSSRFKLMGVVAGLNRQGHALIATDGKAAKPYRVGEPVEDGLVLKAVLPRSAELARTLESPAGITLELPKLAP
jgi:general secretion pathway protein C